MSKLFLMIFAAMVAVGCVQNISQVHTEGEATDVVDDTTSNTPNVDTDLNLPIPNVPNLLK